MTEIWSDVSVWCQEQLGIAPAALLRIALSVLVILVLLAIRFLVHSIVVRRVAEISRRYLLVKTTNYILGFSAIIAITMIWFGNLTGWAAYLGILSAGLAIALQDPVTNFAGWLFIALRKPFAVGDRIQIGEHKGDVIDMRLFQFTLVEIGNWVDADQSTGRIIHVPNGWVFKHSTANYTRGFNFIWNELPITVTFESNWKRAKQILSDIAQKHSVLRTEEAQEQVRRAARKYLIFFQHLTPIVWTSVTENGVTLTIRYICEPRKRRSSETRIWEEVLSEFAAADDIDFAYPTTRFFGNIHEGKTGARAGIPPAGPPLQP